MCADNGKSSTKSCILGWVTFDCPSSSQHRAQWMIWFRSYSTPLQTKQRGGAAVIVLNNGGRNSVLENVILIGLTGVLCRSQKIQSLITSASTWLTSQYTVELGFTKNGSCLTHHWCSLHKVARRLDEI